MSRTRTRLENMIKDLDDEINHLEETAALPQTDPEARVVCHQSMMILQNVKSQITYSLSRHSLSP